MTAGGLSLVQANNTSHIGNNSFPDLENPNQTNSMAAALFLRRKLVDNKRFSLIRPSTPPSAILYQAKVRDGYRDKATNTDIIFCSINLYHHS